MKKIVDFVKAYWLTGATITFLILLYKFIADNQIFSGLYFPRIPLITQTFMDNRELMFTNMLSSFKLLIPSIIITLVVALAIGIGLGLHPYVRRAMHPIIYAFSCVPSILLSPFVVLISPSFFGSCIFLIFYGTVWATLFATITGIETIDKRYLDNAKTLELKGFKLMIKVILPAASPNIMGGFVNSLRSSFVMLVYAEMYGATAGLGFYVKKFSDFGLFPQVWAGFLFMVLVLVIVMQFFERLKNHLLSWTN